MTISIFINELLDNQFSLLKVGWGREDALCHMGSVPILRLQIVLE